MPSKLFSQQACQLAALSVSLFVSQQAFQSAGQQAL